ncbi:MAG: hypothetical protein IKN54_06115 [Lachnospiraceae bacterium]|nr:hypothetical protein [Lachnospiraceae bacterium]
MEDKIPYIVFEGEMTRMERMIKRLWIVIIIMIVLFVGTNGTWLYYESQFSEEVTTITQDVKAKDGNAIVNGTGELSVNGTD